MSLRAVFGRVERRRLDFEEEFSLCPVPGERRRGAGAERRKRQDF